MVEIKKEPAPFGDGTSCKGDNGSSNSSIISPADGNVKGKVLNILVACEESQAVTIELRKLGHKAFSCDIQECSGGHPEWHIIQDVLPLLNGKCYFKTMDGKMHDTVAKWRWDMIIAHPPCTYLTNCATRSHSIRCTPLAKIYGRTAKRIEAMDFFMQFVNANCDKIAIENPIGVMNTCYRKPDQTIHPYMFAESVNDAENYVTKSTCLWLKGLNPLETNGLPKPNNAEIFGTYPNGKARTWEECVSGIVGRAKVRSKTFSGVAKAMAEQWAGDVEGVEE